MALKIAFTWSYRYYPCGSKYST
uniref:Uncharacterized protein n=1 Tax=Tetranychus urticae TaxID=32264 RepID=T1KV31_TETUR